MSAVLIAVLVLLGLGLVFGILLGYSSIRFKVEGNPLVDQVDSLLPQTQCGQCGHPGCRPYAESIVNNDEAINKCLYFPSNNHFLSICSRCADSGSSLATE